MSLFITKSVDTDGFLNPDSYASKKQTLAMIFKTGIRKNGRKKEPNIKTKKKLNHNKEHRIYIGKWPMNIRIRTYIKD